MNSTTRSPDFDDLEKVHARIAPATEELVFSLARNVATARAFRGYTQEQLADRADLSRPTIAKIEGGDAEPTLKTIAALATALEVPPLMLLVDKKVLAGTNELMASEDVLALTHTDPAELEKIDRLRDSGVRSKQAEASQVAAKIAAQAGWTGSATTLGAVLGAAVLPAIPGIIAGALIAGLFSGDVAKMIKKEGE